MESVNDDLPVYLVGDEDADSDETLEEWIRSNFQELFESELEGWYTDPDLWPADRNFDLFKKWFDVECHTVLLDTVGGPIVDDEA